MAVNSWQWLGLQIGNVCVILNNVIYDTWDFSPLVELGSKEQNPVNFRNMHKTKNADWNLRFLVAGAGLERCDLRVMSPTSYQLLHPASRLSHI